MLAKILSAAFAATALSLAVLYAQKKGRENPRRDPVFDTSKSGLPTPIDATDEEKERIRKENEGFQKEKKSQQEQNNVNPAQVNEPAEKWPEPKEYPRKKKKRPSDY